MIRYYQNIHLTSLQEIKIYDLFSCPEWKEDFGSESVLGPTKESDSEEESNQTCPNTETEKTSDRGGMYLKLWNLRET